MALARWLNRHPFPVVTHFDRVVALSFAFPESVVRPLVPEALDLDTVNGFAFVTVAMVWTRQLRPKGFPTWMGQDFFLAGYRVFSRLRQTNGRRLRGLSIVRSDTDKRRMVFMGNVFTGYHYRYARVEIARVGDATQVQSFGESGARTLNVIYRSPNGDVPLPVGSPFSTWKEARRFAGPMPFTFSPIDDRTLVVVEGHRTHWEPRPIAVQHWDVDFFTESPLRDATPILANAFTVEHVDYCWDRGKTMPVAPRV